MALITQQASETGLLPSQATGANRASPAVAFHTNMRFAAMDLPSEPSKGQVLSGCLLSGLAITFLLIDGALKLAAPAIVTDTMTTLGWPGDPATAQLLGLLTIAATLLYAWPRTAVLGAILLTAYLGGAIATHVRIDNPLFSHVLFGVYLAIFVWGGLWLRIPALRALAPLRL